jgi:hypothetical protein
VTPAAEVLEWILASYEPAARWIVRAHLVDGKQHRRLATAEHDAVLADPATQALIDRLPEWESATGLSGHQSPAFAPNLLGLLADMGVAGGDDERIERLLDAMLRHQLPDGRFASFATSREAPEGGWGSLFCDTHAIVDVLLRFGRGQDPRVIRALQTTLVDLTTTNQGPSWLCRPDELSGFRGPGRKQDFCPQATLEALRAWTYLPLAKRPANLHSVARTSLRAWRSRADEQPYMFGHGSRFKIIKWPTTWYDIHGVLDTLGRYPSLWRGRDADPADRRALTELVACMLAYNVAADGTVTPQSCYRGFENYSFGQKKQPSPFATARLLQVLRRFDDLADESAAVDVTELTSSKGGTGTARPPRLRPGSLRPPPPSTAVSRSRHTYQNRLTP